jgi:hypothetical protein
MYYYYYVCMTVPLGANQPKTSPLQSRGTGILQSSTIYTASCSSIRMLSASLRKLLVPIVASATPPPLVRIQRSNAKEQSGDQHYQQIECAL